MEALEVYNWSLSRYNWSRWGCIIGGVGGGGVNIRKHKHSKNNNTRNNNTKTFLNRFAFVFDFVLHYSRSCAASVGKNNKIHREPRMASAPAGKTPWMPLEDPREKPLGSQPYTHPSYSQPLISIHPMYFRCHVHRLGLIHNWSLWRL